ncbi:MAG: energy-coupled thiamine transporter ThiT, partial [Clostridia bacterium]|nr:energy-coupled thiamine transporter ThiT [Clostridia bacterium]
MRYICHVISGCTVWAGMSIPTGGAFVYSLIYNATYMLPETIILILVSYYLGTSLDFDAQIPRRLRK